MEHEGECKVHNTRCVPHASCARGTWTSVQDNTSEMQISQSACSSKEENIPTHKMQRGV